MAIFPGGIATDADLCVAVNNCSTTLDGILSDSATTVNVVSATIFPAAGFISIDNEIIKYTGKTGTSFTTCTRGQDGTTNVGHSSGAVVAHNIIAAHHNLLKDEIIGIEEAFGPESTGNFVDISSAMNPSGWSSYTTKFATKSVNNNIVTISYHIAGTASASTQVQFSGGVNMTGALYTYAPCVVVDNDVEITTPGRASMNRGVATITFKKNWAGLDFSSSSGTSRSVQGTISFCIADDAHITYPS